MKKIGALVLALSLLTGCSSQPAQNENTPEPGTTSPAIVEQSPTAEPQEASGSQTPEPGQTSTPGNGEAVDTNWFTGAVGDSKIHARLEMDDNDNVSGVYYYDKYKTEIEINGHIDFYAEIFYSDSYDMRNISLYEKTEKEGALLGVFRTDDFIQGCWKSGDEIYPMYLIRDGSGLTPPQKPETELQKFDGYWYGLNKDYYNGANAFVKALFTDLLYYELDAYSGGNSGALYSFAFPDKDGKTVKTVFKDTLYDSKEKIYFDFKIENNTLKLDSNNLGYGCGNGVGFDTDYVRDQVEVSMPSALELGIVETQAQEDLFKKLVGDDYGTFIDYTNFVSYENAVMDGIKVMKSDSYLRGLYGYCSYILAPDYIYAGVAGFDEKSRIYTNDPNYKDRIPQPMEEWADRMGNNIEFIYKDLVLAKP